jgi:AraC-like DNA-binding protein
MGNRGNRLSPIIPMPHGWFSWFSGPNGIIIGLVKATQRRYMQFLHYKPQPPLADFVDQLWLSEGAAPTHQMERLLPDTTVELVINLHQDRIYLYDPADQRPCGTAPGCIVSGPRTKYFVIDTRDQVATMGVHFRPGGAFPFFRVPPSELADQSVALDALWGPAAAELRERLLASATPEGKFRVLEACLLQQLAKPLERHPAVGFGIQELRGSQSVACVVDRVGLSQRRFIQLFGEQVGLTPKLFGRVSRFQRVVQTVHRAGEVDWADLALDCGYYDQAHFIHDFQAFSGITPTTYFLQRTQHLNHVPL